MDQQLHNNLFPLYHNPLPKKGPVTYYYRNLPLKGKRPAAGDASPTSIQISTRVVVSAAAYRKFMDLNRIHEVVEGLLKRVDMKGVEALQRPAAQIRKIIQAVPVPDCLIDSLQPACQRLGRGPILVWPVSVPVEMYDCSREYQQSPYLQVTGPQATIAAIKWWWAALFDAPVIFQRELYGKSHRDAAITVAAQRLSGPTPDGTANYQPG